ncbi:MAG: hypothetical protein J6E44_06730 [Lachnospiraceae bacterium]|nr:hypothetical protein [Lachnospiraceae bacterium]
MSEYTLLEHCAPTLAGIKTGNLVSCVYQTKEEVRHDLRIRKPCGAFKRPRYSCEGA